MVNVGDPRVAKCNSHSGSTKETLSLSAVSQLNNSHSVLDGRSLSFAQDEIETSRVNLIPSESCSVIMKHSGEKLYSSESSEILKRLDTVVKRLENVVSSGTTADDDYGIALFQNILSNQLSEYVKVSDEVGGLVAEQGNLVRDAFMLTENLMRMARNYSKPLPADLAKIMQPLSFKLFEINLITISDSASILAWVSMPSAKAFVRDVENASLSSANASIQQYRSSNPLYVSWIRTWLRCVTAVRDLVETYYAVGLVWRPPGGPKPPIPSWTPPTTTSSPPASEPQNPIVPKRQWKRKVDGNEFTHDGMMKEIRQNHGLTNLRHVEGFSYED
ncbi:suppressor of rasval19 [Sparganum proliferum]